MGRKRKQILRHKRTSEKSNNFDVEINGRYVGVWTWERLDNYRRLFPNVEFIDETDASENFSPNTDTL
jgi:hypothetical protein